MKRRDYLARVQTLETELAMTHRELERVTGQRDELRRVVGDVRSYARQEAERAVVDNLTRRDAQRPDVNYVWRSPDGNGWVDAWNGWYPELREAVDQAKAGVGRPWVLQYGEGVVDEDEMRHRLAPAHHDPVEPYETGLGPVPD